MPEYVRRRAGIVKCDLQQRQPGPCLNCHKIKVPCQKRRGLRKEGQQSAANSTPVLRVPAELPTVSESEAVQHQTESPDKFVGYLAKESFLSNTCDQDINEVEAAISQEPDPLTLNSALTLAPEPMFNAFIDAYFINFFPLVPVVDRSDIMVPCDSPLLIQCLCMLGSHYRYPRLSFVPTAESFYSKAKTLVNNNYEKDSLTTLKGLSLIACRSADSPTNVSLDSPWHWLGVATRFAFNMGLHREMTYQGKPAAGMSRRIWWNLFNQDKLQSLCYGRPPAIRLHEIDVSLPTLQDFSVPHPDNEAFLQRTKICIILGKISDAQYGRHQPSIREETTNIDEYLKQWVDELPQDLRLYESDAQTRAPYRRAASELHIMYFTCIILSYRLTESARLGSVSLKVSIVAASCMLQLFKEIYYRNEIAFLLSINNWYCMVASVPLIHAILEFPEDAALYREELNMLRLVLHEMTHTSPSTKFIINNIDRVQRSVLATPSEELNSRPSLALTNAAFPETRDAIFWTRFRPVESWLLFPFPSSISPSMYLLQSVAQISKETACVEVAVDSLPGEEQRAGEEADYTDFPFNFDFGNVQMDDFLLAASDVDIPAFEQSLLP
ncbi:hypothetical protein N7517_010245 [Penicillium concentricum]|uniref:Xylanolytic transcriptional activator regulatory domain-containing protein n=1 Tax=Penicillium concentricum TaxID=293559 RepID=A0A9W9R8M8_9EURO|nr:uncharacterized protein N7517_010245 [Penicillium concentricum]KAJ5355636.1 hypothetical protein N7517_010245 [Penicillium concentricum]